MLRALVWPSDETSPTLLPEEVETLFLATLEWSVADEISSELYIGECQPLYWYRLKGSE